MRRALVILAPLALLGGASLAIAATLPALDRTAQGAATGGGTVTNPCGDASFGFNSVRPSTFPSGQALGRINYDRLGDCPNAHVNVPVVAKSIFVSATPTPNGTGGDAVLIGDCAAATDTICPGAPNTTHVLVFMRDVADSGAGQDQFRILFLSCSSPPLAPTAFEVPQGCVESLGAEGGLLSTGNIQVRLP
jgi:hypothetical protein